MECNHKIEIALKIDQLDQLSNIDITTSRYTHHNDLSDYFNSIYRHAISRYFDYKVGRIYFGAEFCELLIPTYEEVECILEKSAEMKLKATFLSPPVTSYGVKRLKKIIPLLKKYSCEISISDYGVLELLHTENFNGDIISGRLLDKMYHDGRMNAVMFSQYTNAYGYQYLRSPAVASKTYQEVLSRYGINRFDIDIPLYGIDLSLSDQNVKFSAFLPYGYVTTGRNCMMRNCGRREYSGFDLSNHCCSRKCQEYDQLMIQPTTGIHLNSEGMRERSLYMMRKGNTLFYSTMLSLEDEGWFDRIIIQQSLLL